MCASARAKKERALERKMCDERVCICVDGYCRTVQGLLDWFEVDLGFTELLFIQISLCVRKMCDERVCVCVRERVHGRA